MFSLNCKGRLHSFSTPAVMGIINTTPDSFYAGSRKATVEAVVAQAAQMIQDGATFIDVGGQSTRPGSERVSAEDELQRVVPAVEALAKHFPDTFISIDTFYGVVAQQAVQAGAVLVNDVSAGTIDESLLPTVAQLKVPYVLMHLPADPQIMQQHAEYKDVVTDVFDFLSFRLQQLYNAGIYDVIIDPGFGFGKTAAHNFTLLQHLSFFKQFKKPILVGLSRKATVYKTLGITAQEALNGTTVLNTLSLANGASILRVHDVKEAMQAITLYNHYIK